MSERNQRLRRLEAFYAETQHPWGEEPDKLVVDHVDDFLPGPVLDLGCGDGRNALHLAQRGFAVTAVDIVPAAIDELRRHADSRDLAIETHVADVATFPVSRSYANVVCTLTLHFLPRDQAAKLLARVKRQTAPSGLNVSRSTHAMARCTCRNQKHSGSRRGSFAACTTTGRWSTPVAASRIRPRGARLETHSCSRPTRSLLENGERW